MLNLLLPLANLLVVVFAVAMLLRPARAFAYDLPALAGWDPFFANRPDHEVAFDLLFFSQWDEGGNPLVDEGFRYEGLSLEFKFKQNDSIYYRGSAVVAYLQNQPLMTLPPTISNPNVSAASTDFVTLDAFLATDFTLLNTCWTLSPGLFYHHQWAYIAAGVDLDTRCILADGNAVLRMAYSGRLAWLKQVHWDGSDVTPDTRLTNNFIFGLTQVLSPSFIGYVGLQYTYQNGLLDSTLNFVGLYNSAGQPVELVDEVLPRTRSRGQLNLRGRYVPSVGTSAGLDLSVYYDSWAIFNAAVEPNVEFSLGRARLRLWCYVADQRGTKYFYAMPQYAAPYMTQNSNLGTFVLISPGTYFLLPLNSGSPTWMLRAMMLGFYRTDYVSGLGGTLGASVEW
jgi:hypothetical protein